MDHMDSSTSYIGNSAYYYG